MIMQLHAQKFQKSKSIFSPKVIAESHNAMDNSKVIVEMSSRNLHH